MYRHILIPTDGSELSQGALAHGIAMAKVINAKVTVVAVSAPFQTFFADPTLVMPGEFAKEHLERAREAASATGFGIETVHVEHDHPYQAIIDAATQRGCDLIVMASHGRRGLSAVVLGSETVKVLTHSTIPVLVVRATPTAASAAIAA